MSAPKSRSGLRLRLAAVSLLWVAGVSLVGVTSARGQDVPPTGTRDPEAPPPGAPPAEARHQPDRWLAPDKAAHVFGGYWSAGAGYALAGRAEGSGSERRASAIAAGAVAGIGKELFDLVIQGERFSWKDLVADAAGIALLVAVTAAAEP